MKILFALAVLYLSTVGRVLSAEPVFEKLTLTEEFYSEGIAVADIDRDGHRDIVSGPFWYRGPDFRVRQRYASGDALSIQGYSKHFFTWTCDFNEDGHVDILTVGMPGEPAFWFQHPGTPLETEVFWNKHKVHDDISNESPAFVDIDGDDVPELVCIHGGAFGYIRHQRNGDEVSFNFTPVTPSLNYGRFTHGLGVGDVDGDGKTDLLETNGWWQQRSSGELFKFHPHRFAQSGGAQIFAYDFDGDGDNDVVSVQNAHGYGLSWFEQQKNGEKIDFVQRLIMSDQTADNPFGLAISQMHAVALVDMDGDGIKDIVTGKRFWAHGGKDPGAEQLPLLVWLKTIRSKERVIFEPHLIDARSGVGTQLTVADVNQDGKPDLAVGSKLGSFVFLQNDGQADLPWDRQILATGTALFEENIRTTEPLDPAKQARTFTLPQGFEIQLVASEPTIAKPMNLAFDDRGRLWVSSSREYPFPAEEGKPSRDKIVILEDADGDGYAEVSKTFADGLNIPMGLIPFGDGAIVFSIPNILYLQDTDGDDRADKRDVLYGPFDTTNDTHGMCNSFTLGNDGWIYACHGFSNTSRVMGKDGHAIEMHSGNVFRFKPDGSRIELVSNGQVNPFGMAIDSNGDIFTADCHTKPINLVLPGGHHDSFGKPHDGLGYIPEVMSHLHNSTGIGGIALGEESGFPLIYQNSTFGGNVVTGRINRNHFIYQGSSMRAREEADFLIPSDPWFRPVHLQFGPDGALYVADFYNRIIGHYEVDLKHPGRDRHRGRIWRIVFTGNKGRRDAMSAKRPEVLPSKNIVDLLRQFDQANRAQARVIERHLCGILEKDSRGVERLVQFVLDELQGNVNVTAKMILGAENVLRKFDGTLFSDDTVFRLHDSEKMNCLVFQVLAGMDKAEVTSDQFGNLLRSGVKNSSPLVRRFASVAAARQSQVDVVPELTQQLNEAVESQDTFLVHSLKIALRQQLRHWPARFAAATAVLDPASVPAFADICLSVKSADAAEFILNKIEDLSQNDAGMLTGFLGFAATHAKPGSLKRIVEIVAFRYQDDPEFQLEVLRSLRTGVESRGGTLPESMKSLATEIAVKLLGSSSAMWHVHKSDNTIPFAVRKLSLENADSRIFIDTRVRGEALTGVLQSVPFVLNDKFQFSIAGHDSAGNGEQEQNFARLVLQNDKTVLATVRVPANDVAQEVVIDTSRHRGEKAYLQVWDQCPADAFAWIAVGEFVSHPQLNPHPGWQVERNVDALHWSFHDQEYPAGESARENIFVMSVRRESEDGLKKTPLWSSIVRGEKQVGVLRSEPFVLGPSFSFYLAGHDGVPQEPGNEANYVQLRLADDGKVIQKAFPPRNDVAHRHSWDTEAWKGKHAFVELVDQDDSGSYAWLAAGRFSIAGLNPSQRLDEHVAASEVIAEFGLERLRDKVLRLLQTTKSSRLQSHLCRTLIHLNQDVESAAVFHALAEMVAGMEPEPVFKHELVNAVIAFDLDSAKKLIVTATRLMSSQKQAKVARDLSIDQQGAMFLMELLESGSVSTTVLHDQSLVTRLRTHSSEDLTAAVDQLIDTMPETDVELMKTVERRKQILLTSSGNADHGKVVFQKNCVNCHQLGGKGTQVGPNLDGIGRRGLDRLVDDILVPSRNVDRAFRASLVSTIDGRILTGFLKKTGDSATHINLVDGMGESTLIHKDDIEATKMTTLSPMPGNFADMIPESDFSDLIAYLLRQ